MNRSIKKGIDFPCTKINGIYHVTKDSSSCLCGKKWTYGGMSMNNKIIVSNPIMWKEFDEITCESCRQALTNNIDY